MKTVKSSQQFKAATEIHLRNPKPGCFSGFNKSAFPLSMWRYAPLMLVLCTATPVVTGAGRVLQVQ